MTESFLKPLSLGTSTFEALRQANEIYVDKTNLVFELAKNRSKLFLARPRRFGKSLLISTFESLFARGLQHFKGLAIESHWTDKTYDVVRLDFSEVKEFADASEFAAKFAEKVAFRFRRLDPDFGKTQGSITSQLADWLSERPVSSLVILIDEYDAPFTACLTEPELYEKVRSVMSEFFLTLKANEGCLRFFFMAGITKLSNTSIFSAFNNLNDISLNPAYGALLGYTEDEIHHYFGAYLIKAQKALGLSSGDLIRCLRSNYNGFCFDKMARTHVFCPWSLLNFFSYPELGFENYWYASGGRPNVLMRYLADHSLDAPMAFDQSIALPLSDLSAARQYSDISLPALLTQAGYLTIRSAQPGDFVMVGYPNLEVTRSMAQLYAEELLKGKVDERARLAHVASALAQASADSVIDFFNRVFPVIDYQNHPVKNEAACRAFIQVLLMGAALLPEVEVHNAHGRSDMEVRVGNRHWVFEFKFAKDDKDTDQLLEEAVDQIRSRHYGEQHRNIELIRVALVFSKTERRFTAWQTI